MTAKHIVAFRNQFHKRFMFIAPLSYNSSWHTTHNNNYYHSARFWRTPL